MVSHLFFYQLVLLGLLGFVKLLRLRRSSGQRVPLPGPLRPLGGPLRAGHFGPTRESLPHLLPIVGC
jgi:hypothetical protein